MTDRPDFTESAFTLPFSSVQFEGGISLDINNNIKNITFPSLLTRIALHRSLEVRLGFTGWTYSEEKSKTYLNDLILEAKYQLSINPELPAAILLVSKLPTGSEEISVENPEYGIKLAASHPINNYFTLSSNLGAISVVGSNDQRELLYLFSLSMGFAITDNTGWFLEFFSLMPDKHEWQPSIDSGFTYLIGNNLQLDLFAGFGLNNFTSDLFAGLGISYNMKY
ncbi:transporter [Melioribacter sp. OK-6-Me]|uniref:transporter n=1 Tax=unclassified Melioribacter TaxID=2627329 RepID=UPI003EDB42FF